MGRDTIRLLPLGGTWETLGADTLRGIVPEDIEASADDWGPSTMRFALKAAPGTQRPDLAPYTPVEYERDGAFVWSGFTWERPTAKNSFTVGCRGWQYHLDDDLFERVYVHTRLSDWRDERSFLGALLTSFTATGKVEASDGGIVLGWANDDSVGANECAGVMLDLGSDNTAKRIVVNTSAFGGDAFAHFRVRGHDSEDFSSGSPEDIINVQFNNLTDGFRAGTFTTARRYVSIFLIRTDSLSGKVTADRKVRLNSVQVFRDVAWESANASTLEADEVIRDALKHAPLLNQSTSLISDGTFAIPDFRTDGYGPPRQAMEAVNTFENYRQKVGGADGRTLIFEPKPSAAMFEVGAWSGYELATTDVSGEEIYDKVIVDGTGPDGSRLVVKRSQTGTLPDRRGQSRARVLPMRSPFSTAVGNQIGDLWLTEHRSAPFSGTLTLAGRGIRKHLGGMAVAAASMLLYTGEKIRFMDQIDPDTGDVGRDGRIAGVTYRARDDSLTIAIDDRREHFERLLARYSVLVDQFT